MRGSRKYGRALKGVVLLGATLMLLLVHSRSRSGGVEETSSFTSAVLSLMERMLEDSYASFLYSPDVFDSPASTFHYVYSLDSSGKLLRILREGRGDASLKGIDLSQSKVFRMAKMVEAGGLLTVFSPFSEREMLCFVRRRGDSWEVGEVNLGAVFGPVVSLAKNLGLRLLLVDPEGKVVWTSEGWEKLVISGEGGGKVRERAWRDWKGITLAVERVRGEENYKVLPRVFVAVPLFLLTILLYELANALERMEMMER